MLGSLLGPTTCWDRLLVEAHGELQHVAVFVNVLLLPWLRFRSSIRRPFALQVEQTDWSIISRDIFEGAAACLCGYVVVTLFSVAEVVLPIFIEEDGIVDDVAGNGGFHLDVPQHMQEFQVARVDTNTQVAAARREREALLVLEGINEGRLEEAGDFNPNRRITADSLDCIVARRVADKLGEEDGVHRDASEHNVKEDRVRRRKFGRRLYGATLHRADRLRGTNKTTGLSVDHVEGASTDHGVCRAGPSGLSSVVQGLNHGDQRFSTFFSMPPDASVAVHPASPRALPFPIASPTGCSYKISVTPPLHSIERQTILPKLSLNAAVETNPRDLPSTSGCADRFLLEDKWGEFSDIEDELMQGRCSSIAGEEAMANEKEESKAVREGTKDKVPTEAAEVGVVHCASDLKLGRAQVLSFGTTRREFDSIVDITHEGYNVSKNGEVLMAVGGECKGVAAEKATGVVRGDFDAVIQGASTSSPPPVVLRAGMEKKESEVYWKEEIVQDDDIPGRLGGAQAAFFIPQERVLDDVVDNVGNEGGGNDRGDHGLRREVVNDLEDFDGHEIMEAVGLIGPLYGLLRTLNPARVGRAVSVPLWVVRVLTDPIVDSIEGFGHSVLSSVLSVVSAASGSLFGDVQVELLRIYFALKVDVTLMIPSVVFWECWECSPHKWSQGMMTGRAQGLLSVCFQRFVALIFGQERVVGWIAVISGHVIARGTQFQIGLAGVLESWTQYVMRDDSFGDRVLGVVMGYVVVVGVIVCFTQVNGQIGNNWSAGRYVIGVVRRQLLLLKLTAFMGLEVSILPLFHGAALDSCKSWFGRYYYDSVEIHIVSESQSSGRRLVYHWIFGMMFSEMVIGFKRILRPGVLWFIADRPNADQVFRRTQETLRNSTLTLLRKIVVREMALLMVLGVGILGIAILGHVGTFAVMPLRWNYPFSVPMGLVFLIGVLLYSLHHLHPRTRLNETASAYSMWLAARLRLSSYLFGGRHPDEEFTPPLRALVLGLFGSTVTRGPILAEYDGTFRRVSNTNESLVSGGGYRTIEVGARGEPVDEQGRLLMLKQDVATLKAGRKIEKDYVVVYLPLVFAIVLSGLLWQFGLPDSCSLHSSFGCLFFLDVCSSPP
ncbi:hypothetical protein PM082_005420 [Marasmius tenuissimus]|nr:hypothetical protein PM082_005420 [Marasmius tenuissimus]